jgi:hypothetical protein
MSVCWRCLTCYLTHYSSKVEEFRPLDTVLESFLAKDASISVYTVVIVKHTFMCLSDPHCLFYDALLTYRKSCWCTDARSLITMMRLAVLIAAVI